MMSNSKWERKTFTTLQTKQGYCKRFYLSRYPKRPHDFFTKSLTLSPYVNSTIKLIKSKKFEIKGHESLECYSVEML